MRLAILLLCVIPSVVEGSGSAGGTMLAPHTRPDPSTGARDDYDDELQRIDRELASATVERRVYFLYLKASLTGDFHDFRAVEEADPPPIVRAHLAYKLHKFNDAAKAGDPALNADVAFNLGRDEEARRAYEKLPPTWDNLCRLAHYRAQHGDVAGADRLYVQAEDDLTVKQMRDFAWVELQRGVLDFDHGRPKQALEHYERANAAWSGWWLIDEHRAEALNALGRTEEAVALYRDVIARAPHPELISALAAILESEELFAEAERGFAEQMAMYPEAALAHYVEHLMRRGGEAKTIVALAERNYALRPNGEAKKLLEKARRYNH